MNMHDYDKECCMKLKKYSEFLNIRNEIPDDSKTLIRMLKC